MTGLPDGWQAVPLAQAAREITVGHVGPMADQYVDSGIPFLRSKDIEPFEVLTDDLKFISDEFHAKLAKSRLTPGDIVIVRTGKPGAAAVVPEVLAEANCSDVVIVRPTREVNATFLCAYINSPAAHRHVAAHTVGAVQQHFNVGHAKTLMLGLPPEDEQRRIAGVLQALDGNIAAERTVRSTISALLSAQFENALAKGAVERGQSLSTIADFVNGGAFTKGASGQGRPVLRIRELTPELSMLGRSERSATSRTSTSLALVICSSAGRGLSTSSTGTARRA